MDVLYLILLTIGLFSLRLTDGTNFEWREDCSQCSEVSGVTVRPWQMVFNGSGVRWGGGMLS